MNRTAIRCLVLAGLWLTTQALAAELEKGIASYYADSLHGNPTASGESYDKNALTGAHRTLPFGSRVQVTNLENGATVVVRINDRGPFVQNRVIDVSGAAAKTLGFVDSGTTEVTLEVLEEQ